MQEVSMFDAKTNLSKLVERALHGQRIRKAHSELRVWLIQSVRLQMN